MLKVIINHMEAVLHVTDKEDIRVISVNRMAMLATS